MKPLGSIQTYYPILVLDGPGQQSDHVPNSTRRATNAQILFILFCSPFRPSNSISAAPSVLTYRHPRQVTLPSRTVVSLIRSAINADAHAIHGLLQLHQPIVVDRRASRHFGAQFASIPDAMFPPPPQHCHPLPPHKPVTAPHDVPGFSAVATITTRSTFLLRPCS
ncbi:hypothetical protein BDZ89DRAFT_195601 [Hymenopellis radicata]|nr:hypothetical protein BDZ89DRAFT_195601 [Hymenopellis radicata]